MLPQVNSVPPTPDHAFSQVLATSVGRSRRSASDASYYCSSTKVITLSLLLCAGSELSLAVEAAKELEGDGKKVRVVSFVSWELFEEQDQGYKDSVLPPDVTARVSVEAGVTLGWQKCARSPPNFAACHDCCMPCLGRV